MRKKTIASKLLASALCACLLTFGWPTAVLAQNAVGGSATPDGAVAGTLPAGGSLEQTGPADGGLVPSAPTVAITGFADLPDDVAAQSHEVGELGGLDDLNLPATLEAAAEGGDALSVPVSGWASDPAFDPDAAGAYTFAPALDLPEDAALAQDATPPTVTVTLTEPVAMLAATPSTTVDSWTDLKSEVENPDGAAVIEIAGPLTATSKISVSRAVAIHSATGHIFTITRDSAFRSSFFDVADGDLTLQDVVLDGNKGVATNSSSLVNVNTGGKLTLGGGAALQNNKRSFGYGGGVYVENGSHFVMQDGSGVTGNEIIDNGGGVYVTGAGSSFEMRGGRITGNKAGVNYGGGVYVGGGASMKTSGAARIGGTAAGEANTAQNGGGAYVTGAGSQLAMTGGLLAAQSGDAVYVGSAHSTFTVSGGTVMQTGENGRAIYSEGSTTDKVKVEGKAAVYSRGEAVAYEDASLSFPGPAGDGIVIKQTGDHAPYDAGSATDLERVPATAKAVWDTQGGSGGIVYENGENKGFLDLGVKVRQIAPVITTDSKLPDGAVGKAYSTTLAATGAPAPGWKVTDGALPDGLSLDRDSGEISGTPEQAGSFSFEVTAANGVSPDDSRTFGLAVRPPDYAMRTLTDKATGISVRGLFTDDAALAVAKDAALHPAGCPACDAIRAKQETDKLVALYGISLSAGFGKGDMEVRFPVSAEYDGKTVAILHCLDGALETVEAKAEGGATTGTFGGLSPFALFVPKDADPNPLPGPDSTSPQTGDGPSAAPFAALAFLSLLAAGLATLQLGRCRREDGSETE